jgi:hypothetical protein
MATAPESPCIISSISRSMLIIRLKLILYIKITSRLLILLPVKASASAGGKVR